MSKKPRDPRDVEIQNLKDELARARLELAQQATLLQEANELRGKIAVKDSELEELRSFRDYAQRSFMILEALSKQATNHRKYTPDLTHLLKR